MNREFKAAGCEGKVAFTSMAIAELARRRREAPRHTYRCPSCGLLHLGRSIKRTTQSSTRTRRIAEVREAEAFEG